MRSTDRAVRLRRSELKDDVVDRIVRDAGGNPERLLAWARAAGLACIQEDEARGYVTWYTAAEYLADLELKRWLANRDECRMPRQLCC